MSKAALVLVLLVRPGSAGGGFASLRSCPLATLDHQNRVWEGDDGFWAAAPTEIVSATALTHAWRANASGVNAARLRQAVLSDDVEIVARAAEQISRAVRGDAMWPFRGPAAGDVDIPRANRGDAAAATWTFRGRPLVRPRPQVLGTSMTAGTGCKDACDKKQNHACAWPARFERILQKLSEAGGPRVINKAQGAAW